VGCLGWFIETKVGPFQSVTISDNGLVGATFECSQMSVRLWSVDASGNLQQSFDPTAAGVTVTKTCSPAGFQLTATNIPADRLLRVLIHATPTQPAPNGGVTFKNTAVVTQVSSSTVSDQNTVTAQRRTGVAGGNANGVIPPTTTTTVATVDTTAPTTTAVAVLPPSPPTFAPPPNATLPATGASHTGLLWASLAMVLSGTALMIVAVRRREAPAS